MHVRFCLSVSFRTFLIEAFLARPKPTTQASLTQSSVTLSAPPPDALEPQADRIDDEKADGVPSEDEEEASSGGAFDPVTGKINWDGPCLGGMAYGPCGMQFREAFSCFVFSEEEPKGIDCVEKFKAMQDCFRENPDVYGEGTLLCPASLFLPQQTTFLFQTEILGDDDDEDGESPTQVISLDSGDAVPASPAIHPAQSPSNQVSPKPA